MRHTTLIGLAFISILFISVNQSNAEIIYGDHPTIDKPLIQISKFPSTSSAILGTNVTVTLNITNWSTSKTAYNLTIAEPLLSDWTLSTFKGWDSYIWLEVGPSGSISYSYSLTVKRSGNYEIGATHVTYYDENSTKYEARSQAITIRIYETIPPISQNRAWRNIGFISLGILLTPIIIYTFNQVFWRKE